MAIIGSHMPIYTPEADAVRATFWMVRVLAGGRWRWLVDLPFATVGARSAPLGSWGHRDAISLLCDDIASTMDELGAKGITFSGPVEDHGYGLVTYVELAGWVRCPALRTTASVGDRRVEGEPPSPFARHARPATLSPAGEPAKRVLRPGACGAGGDTRGVLGGCRVGLVSRLPFRVPKLGA